METRRSVHNEQLISQGGTPSMSAPLTRPKVLLAEDQPDMRHLVGKVLREAGYDVVELQSGTDLWSEIVNWQSDEDNPRDPDLIVTDIRMPGSTGLEVLARLRQSDWATPVILMTAFGDLATFREALQLGATRIFNKPFDVNDLVTAARRLIDPRGD
jgi:CheY-like chemotaxis protein